MTLTGAVSLGAFLWVKGSKDVLVVIVAAVMMVLIFVDEKWFLKSNHINMKGKNIQDV